ncbi:unnamed protein product [Protopolystoma xenopodis]|uniref:Uncharacterized protein n=1 Tax=Protopolystoma xenopodis TaxID=117903 RepID=A0A3S5B8F2_9PLAT|nr:unnamed protein product [Protopolystoma xenopodis]
MLVSAWYHLGLRLDREAADQRIRGNLPRGQNLAMGPSLDLTHDPAVTTTDKTIPSSGIDGSQGADYNIGYGPDISFISMQRRTHLRHSYRPTSQAPPSLPLSSSSLAGHKTTDSKLAPCR